MMTTWSFYDKTTGLFTSRRFSGYEGDVPAATPPDCIAIEGVFDRTRQRIEFGVPNQVVDYQPPKPDDTDLVVYEWDAEAWRWVEVSTILAKRLDKWEQIKLARFAAEQGGFIWDGSAFDSDSMSQQRIQGAVQLALLAMQSGQAFEIDWTLADNSVRTLDGSDMVAVGVALGEHVGAQFARGRVLREAIEEALDDEALSAISW